MELKDKVVIVTGAAQGLGRQFALACAENGMKRSEEHTSELPPQA